MAGAEVREVRVRGWALAGADFGLPRRARESRSAPGREELDEGGLARLEDLLVKVVGGELKRAVGRRGEGANERDASHSWSAAEKCATGYECEPWSCARDANFRGAVGWLVRQLGTRADGARRARRARATPRSGERGQGDAHSRGVMWQGRRAPNQVSHWAVTKRLERPLLIVEPSHPAPCSSTHLGASGCVRMWPHSVAPRTAGDLFF